MEQASRSFMTGIRTFSASFASHFSFVALYCSSVLRLRSLSGEYRCLALDLLDYSMSKISTMMMMVLSIPVSILSTNLIV